MVDPCRSSICTTKSSQSQPFRPCLLMLSHGARLANRGRAQTLDEARSTGTANEGQALLVAQGRGKGA